MYFVANVLNGASATTPKKMFGEKVMGEEGGKLVCNELYPPDI